MRDFLTTLLERCSEIELCALAGDGREAVEKYRCCRPDIALLDIRMPKMDGIAATRTILSEFPDACILVLTSFDIDGSMAQARAAGAVDCLLKDTPREELMATVLTCARAARSTDKP